MAGRRRPRRGAAGAGHRAVAARRTHPRPALTGLTQPPERPNVSSADASDDPLLLTTEQHERRPSRQRALLPCLTILALPDRLRLGERAALKGLLAGRAVEVSRTQPLFGPPGGAPSAPLLDPGISRTPFRVRAEGRGFAIEPCGVALRVNGEETTERVVVDATAVAA